MKHTLTPLFFSFIMVILQSCSMPKAHEVAFAERYPNAKKVKWSIDKNGFHEVKFEWGDQRYRADFYEDGQWRETEQNVKWKSVPKNVKETILKITEKDSIVEIEAVDSYEYGYFYDVEYKIADTKIDVMINILGDVLKFTP